MSNYIKLNNTRHLTGKLGDVRKTSNFRLFIEGVTENNSLDLIIDQAFLPQVSVSVLELRHGNDSKKLAGTASWQGGTIVVKDVLSRKELDALQDWQEKVVQFTDEVGTIIGIASEYKKNGYIVEYAGNGRMQRKWTVYGLWISDLNLGNLNAADSSLKEITVTLQVDPSPIRPEYYDESDSEYNK